jgi:hypothetical protein
MAVVRFQLSSLFTLRKRNVMMFSSTKILVALILVSTFAIVWGVPVAKADVVTPAAVIYRSVDDPDIYAADGDTEAQWGIPPMIDGLHAGGDVNPFGILQDDTSADPKNSPTDPITGYLVFDLGAKKDLTGASVWGRFLLDGADPRGPKNVGLFTFAGDSPHGFAVSTDIVSDPTVTMLATQDLPITVDGEAATVAFSTTGTQYLGMVINSSYSANNIQIREIGFNTVPEPSTLVLATGGVIGLLCYAWRKRR